MPIYAYKCASCGFAKDVLQKLSDAPLSECSSCGKPTFSKQLTAAGFQLKGSGWYATDFKGGQAAGAVAADAVAPSSDSAASEPALNTSASQATTASAACAPSCACHP